MKTEQRTEKRCACAGAGFAGWMQFHTPIQLGNGSALLQRHAVFPKDTPVKKRAIVANGGKARRCRLSDNTRLMNDPELWALLGFGIAAVYALGVYIKISRIS